MSGHHQHRQRVKYTSPFAPLALLDVEAESLEQLSRMILRDYVAQYEAFQRQGGTANVDTRVWKPIKRRGDVCVFAQRKHHDDEQEVGFDNIRESVASLSESGARQPSDLPVMLTVGSMTGTLDDLMYGLVCPTIEVMRIKTSYIIDQVNDCVVLQTIASPTEDDPFQSVVIKWVQNQQSFLLRPAVNSRDFVYMERTGIAHTASGERLGFQLLHSVHFPQTHELPSFIRGNISFCGIYRQNEESNRVDMYLRAIVDPCGSAIRPMVILAAADMFISVWKFLECSYHKKLAWWLRTKRGKVESGQSASHQLGPCVVCRRPPSKARSALGDSHKRRCILCANFVCSSCRLKKTLSQVDSPTGKLWRRAFAVCPTCYDEVRRSNAFAIAQQELALSDVTEGLMALSSVASSSVCSPTASDISSIF